MLQYFFVNLTYTGLNEHTDTEEFYVASTWTDFLVFDPLQVGGNYLSFALFVVLRNSKNVAHTYRIQYNFRQNTNLFLMHVCSLDISWQPFTENVTFSAKYHIIFIVIPFSLAILLVLDQGLSNWAPWTPRGPQRIFRGPMEGLE